MPYTLTALQDVSVKIVAQTSMPNGFMAGVSQAHLQNLVFYGTFDISLKSGETREDVLAVDCVWNELSGERIHHPPHPKEVGDQSKVGDLLLIQCSL